MYPPDDEAQLPQHPDDHLAKLEIELRVRHMHRRDINRVWDFLKLVFRHVQSRDS